MVASYVCYGNAQMNNITENGWRIADFIVVLGGVVSLLKVPEWCAIAPS